MGHKHECWWGTLHGSFTLKCGNMPSSYPVGSRSISPADRFPPTRSAPLRTAVSSKSRMLGPRITPLCGNPTICAVGRQAAIGTRAASTIARHSFYGSVPAAPHRMRASRMETAGFLARPAACSRSSPPGWSRRSHFRSCRLVWATVALGNFLLGCLGLAPLRRQSEIER